MAFALERGANGLYPSRRADRISVGHRGMLEAFANIYADLHAAIAAARLCSEAAGGDFPGFDAGLE